MSEHIVIKKSTLIDIADTIRAKTGLTDPIKISDINTENEEIMSNMNLPDLTNPASASHIFEGKEVLDESGKVIVGEMPKVEQAVPSVDVSASGLITAITAQDTGYVEGGTKNTTKQLSVQSAKTITPSTIEQVAVESGKYTTGEVKVAAIPVVSQATPNVSINEATGLITATVSQDGGYVEEGTKSATKQLVTKASTTVTPTKSAQTVVEANVYTTGDIVVNPIPSEYITTADATASADEIMNGETAYVNGNKVTGTMPNNNAVSQTLNTNTTSYTIPKGYHNGSGKVSITTETKSVTPTKSVQTVSPTSGKVLSSVTVESIPSAYQDVSEVTATASDVLSGKKIVNNSGNVVTGTIATKTSNDLTASGATVTVPSGYYASQATKSVATATRAETTITTTADDTNDKLTITASNNQTTGYVTGANKTASMTVSLTANGATVTASDGTKSISKSVASGSATTPATTITKAPAISVNSSGLITASVSGTQNVTPTVNAGYVSSGSAGTITVSGSATKQLTTQAAKTVTPSTVSQTAVNSGVYTTGVVTVVGDANLKAENIAEGVSIFGVEGSHTGGIDTSDATADASEIMSGETAYVGGSKITGTFTIDSELSAQDDLIYQIQAALQNKTATSGGITLPTLSNPATSENLEEGYELIDGDGNIVVGTHICDSGSGDGESITFSVINNLPDLISVYGKACLPYETTVISVSTDVTQLYGTPIAIWIGMIDGEQRDYYNNYLVYLSYSAEGDDGEPYDEIFTVYMKPQDDYPFCALGITEYIPFGGECLTFYCEEV